MAQFEWVHAAWLALAIVLEIVANVFLKFFSDGSSQNIWLALPGGGAGCL